MTIWAILSDVHGRSDRLARVLDDASTNGAARILSLGDVGGEHALSRLDSSTIDCVFGNWEASGLRGLRPDLRRFVGSWRPCFRADGFWAAHASPVWPPGLDIAAVVSYLRDQHLAWQTLFPSLRHSEAARRAALAALDEQHTSLFFHGHTHVQEIWRREPDQPLLEVEDRDVVLSPGCAYLIGVGSAGQPEDGQPGYGLYDSETRRVRLMRV